MSQKGITRVDALLALVRDHISNRHAARAWPGCPVCEKAKQ